MLDPTGMLSVRGVVAWSNSSSGAVATESTSWSLNPPDFSDLANWGTSVNSSNIGDLANWCKCWSVNSSGGSNPTNRSESWSLTGLQGWAAHTISTTPHGTQTSIAIESLADLGTTIASSWAGHSKISLNRADGEQTLWSNSSRLMTSNLDGRATCRPDGRAACIADDRTRLRSVDLATNWRNTDASLAALGATPSLRATPTKAVSNQTISNRALATILDITATTAASALLAALGLL